MECLYLSAPTSPGWRSPETVQFYSTRSSPFYQTDEFGFEFEFETSQNILANGWDQEDHEYSLPARANSFSTLAFADELFCKGQVLPLKPPPRIQTSVPTSPRSFSSRVRNPFAQRSTWNDGFDPFMMALEKVSEETEGRLSVHRRSHSYSPLKTGTSVSRTANRTIDDQEKERTVTEMMGRKGSMYSRWVRSQTMVKKRSDWTMEQSPARTMIKRLCLGPNTPVKPIKQNELTSRSNSKMQKLKSVLFRYASVKKETSESKPKISYIKRLSDSFKTNLKKKESIEQKMPRCLVYARGSANKL